MSGAGGGPAGFMPSGGVFLPPEAPPRSAIGSHRKLDPVTRRYVVTDDGGYAVDDNIAQRVLLLICFGVTQPSFITPQSKNKFVADLRSALQILTTGKAPTIKILEIAVDDGGGELLVERLRYFNNLTRTTQTLKPNGELVIS